MAAASPNARFPLDAYRCGAGMRSATKVWAVRWARKGPYTYDRIALPNAHGVAQLVQRLYILFASFSERHVLDVEAFVAPGAHRLDVELLILGRDVQDRRTLLEREPPIAIRQKLLRH